MAEMDLQVRNIFRTYGPAATLAIAMGVLGGLACNTRQVASKGAEPASVSGEKLERLVWTRHTIDDTGKGADGARFGDLNGDGLPDIVTPWEEGGVVRAYLHPGFPNAREKWPAVTIGNVKSPEDAVFVDLDGDGNLDVISSTEGNDRSIYFHWAPKRERLLLESAWVTAPLSAAKDRMRWMFAAPNDIDGKNGIDFFAGGKRPDAAVGWFEAPLEARNVDGWQWHPLREVGWLMSLIPVDMDGDGDTDLLLSDRMGTKRGILWLEHPGHDSVHGPWKEHSIGAVNQSEVMFLTYEDLDGDGLKDVIAAVKPQHLEFYRRLNPKGDFAEPVNIPFPAGAGTAKGVAVGDLNGDGVADLVISCEHAEGDKRGVLALVAAGDRETRSYLPWDISGIAGTKFDLVKLVDVDGDGDLDVITCEEAESLGVFWYENPAG